VDSWIPIITGLGGLGAIALFFREIVAIVKMLRNGVAARESTRKSDIIAQRDDAVARAAASEARTDRERENRRLIEAHAARLQRQLILGGGEPPEWPDIDETTDITNR
jgi:hypothetical protein